MHDPMPLFVKVGSACRIAAQLGILADVRQAQGQRSALSRPSVTTGR